MIIWCCYFEGFGWYVFYDIGEDFEIGGVVWNEGVGYDMVWLVGIGYFGGDEIIEVVGDFVGYVIEQVDVLIGVQIVLFVFEGGMGSLYGSVDIGLVGFDDLGDDFVVQW